jgi:hypothetical protein
MSNPVLTRLAGAVQEMPPLTAIPRDESCVAAAPELGNGIGRYLQRILPDMTLIGCAWSHPAEPVQLILSGQLKMTPTALATRIAGFLGVAVNVTAGDFDTEDWGTFPQRCLDSAAEYGARFNALGPMGSAGRAVLTDDSLRSHVWLTAQSDLLSLGTSNPGEPNRYGSAPLSLFRCDGELSAIFERPLVNLLERARSLQLAVAGGCGDPAAHGATVEMRYVSNPLSNLTAAAIPSTVLSTSPAPQLVPKLGVLAEKLDELLPRDIAMDFGFYPTILLMESGRSDPDRRAEIETLIRLHGGANLEVQWCTQGESYPISPTVLRFSNAHFEILLYAIALPRPSTQRFHEVFSSLRDWVRLEGIPALVALPSPGRLLISLNESATEVHTARLLEGIATVGVSCAVVATRRA